MTRPRRMVWFAVFAAAALLLPSRVVAQSGTLTDDGFVSTNPVTQHLNLNGHGIVLIVAGSSATFNYQQVGTTKTFLKFQLPSSLPPNVAPANVAKATLKLFFSTGTMPTGAIDFYTVTSP